MLFQPWRIFTRVPPSWISLTQRYTKLLKSSIHALLWLPHKWGSPAIINRASTKSNKNSQQTKSVKHQIKVLDSHAQITTSTNTDCPAFHRCQFQSNCCSTVATKGNCFIIYIISLSPGSWCRSACSTLLKEIFTSLFWTSRRATGKTYARIARVKISATNENAYYEFSQVYVVRNCGTHLRERSGFVGSLDEQETSLHSHCRLEFQTGKNSSDDKKKSQHVANVFFSPCAILYNISRYLPIDNGPRYKHLAVRPLRTSVHRTLQTNTCTVTTKLLMCQAFDAMLRNTERLKVSLTSFSYTHTTQRDNGQKLQQYSTLC